MSQEEVVVPEVTSLAHGEARKFPVWHGGRVVEGFVLRVHDRFVAYVNLCRHWTIDLDMGTGQFWSERLGRIYCKTHGALYEPFSGICDRGPCVGARLEPLDLELRGDDAVVSARRP